MYPFFIAILSAVSESQRSNASCTSGVCKGHGKAKNTFPPRQITILHGRIAPGPHKTICGSAHTKHGIKGEKRRVCII